MSCQWPFKRNWTDQRANIYSISKKKMIFFWLIYRFYLCCWGWHLLATQLMCCINVTIHLVILQEFGLATVTLSRNVLFHSRSISSSIICSWMSGHLLPDIFCHIKTLAQTELYCNKYCKPSWSKTSRIHWYCPDRGLEESSFFPQFIKLRRHTSHIQS